MPPPRKPPPPKPSAGPSGISGDNWERHCERSEAIHSQTGRMDCFVASLLAMTGETADALNDPPSSPRPHPGPPAARLDYPAVRLQAVPHRGVPHAGDRLAYGVPN